MTGDGEDKLQICSSETGGLRFTVREGIQARKDARYPALLREVKAFCWPGGQPMVPDTWAEILATHAMCAIRRVEGRSCAPMEEL